MNWIYSQLNNGWKENRCKYQYGRGHVHKYPYKEQNEIDQEEDDHRIVTQVQESGTYVLWNVFVGHDPGHSNAGGNQEKNYAGGSYRAQNNR